jgi:sec-independent protein translocase protein TatC
MFIKQYIKEIKYRIILVTLCWVMAFLSCFLYKEILLYVCLKPSQTHTLTEIHFITTNVFEVFTSHLIVIHLISNHVTSVFWLNQILVFTLPSLYNNEGLIAKSLFKTSFLCFISTNFLFYYIIFPVCWYFFFNYLPFPDSFKISIFLEPKLEEYLVNFSYVYFIVNINTQLLVFLIFYMQWEKNKTKLYKKFKKTYIFLLFVLAALVTPPDIFSQLTLVFILLVLLETIKFFFVLYELFLIRQPVKTY